MTKYLASSTDEDRRASGADGLKRKGGVIKIGAKFDPVYWLVFFIFRFDEIFCCYRKRKFIFLLHVTKFL